MKKITSGMLVLVAVLIGLNSSAQILKSNFPAPPKLVPAPTLPIKASLNFAKTYSVLLKGFGASNGSMGDAIAALAELKFNSDGTITGISTWSSATLGMNLAYYSGSYSMYSSYSGRIVFSKIAASGGVNIYEPYDFYLSNGGSSISLMYTQAANTMPSGTTYLGDGYILNSPSIASGSQYIFSYDGFFNGSPTNRKTALGTITFGSGNTVTATYTVSVAGVNTTQTVSGSYILNGNRVILSLANTKPSSNFQLLISNDYKTIYAFGLDFGEVVTGKWTKL